MKPRDDAIIPAQDDKSMPTAKAVVPEENTAQPGVVGRVLSTVGHYTGITKLFYGNPDTKISPPPVKEVSADKKESSSAVALTVLPVVPDKKPEPVKEPEVFRPQLKDFSSRVCEILNTENNKKMANFWSQQVRGVGGEDVERHGIQVAPSVPSGIADMIIQARMKTRNQESPSDTVDAIQKKAINALEKTACLPLFDNDEDGPPSRKKSTHHFYKIVGRVKTNDPESVAAAYTALEKWQTKFGCKL